MRQLAIILLFLISIGAFAQQDSTYTDSAYVSVKVVGGDTILSYYLTDVLVLDEGEMVRYNWLLKRVKKVYPLAIEAVDNLNKYNTALAEIDSKRERKRYMKEQTELLKEGFKEMISGLTESEGHVLCKIIHRNSGLTAYDILETYRGSFTAFSWQTVAKMGGADLRLTHDAEGEDFLLEYIVTQVENCEVYVDMDVLSKD